jgi:ComF family protein
MKKIFEILIKLLFPPRCVSCAEILPLDHKGALCDTCAPVYALRRYDECGVCVQPICECTCPNRYLERHNVHKCGKLIKYIPQDNDDVCNRIIFRLKKANAKSVTNFLATELVPVVDRLVGDKKEVYVLTGAPRSRSSLGRYGYDHVVDLCKEVSRLTGIPYVKAVLRVGNEGLQKQKSKKERVKSAMLSYAPNPRVSLKGKRVILIDDIVTSGATVAACAHAIRKTGAKTVHCATIGFHYRYDQIYKNW